MPRKRKLPQDWTTDEAVRNLFPKPVVTELNKIANKGKAVKRVEKPGDSVHKSKSTR